jgi:outer membrane protein assembly factor BamD (BamD/ComL family)
LVAQATGFGRLGRIRDERTNLERLLAEFPRSVYAARARERLASLAQQ